MIRTELFKLRHHRTPWVLLATSVASLAIAPIYHAIRNPADTQTMTETFVTVFSIVVPLLAVVFGGWIVGHEFRQGTLRRVLGNDARRGRLFATKAGVGFGVLLGAMTLVAGVGASATAASAASFGGSLDWDGVVRDVLSGGFAALVTAAIAFGLSVLLRSDTYAMLGALAVMLIVGPLLTLIPTVGKYMPSALTDDVASWISGAGDLGVSIVPASLGLTATLAALGATAMVTFQRRDI